MIQSENETEMERFVEEEIIMEIIRCGKRVWEVFQNCYLAILELKKEKNLINKYIEIKCEMQKVSASAKQKEDKVRCLLYSALLAIEQILTLIQAIQVKFRKCKLLKRDQLVNENTELLILENVECRMQRLSGSSVSRCQPR